MPCSNLLTPYAAVTALWLAAGGVASAKVTFEDQIKPIFREHCAGCHNQDDAASDLALDGFDAAITGGAGGEVLTAGDPDGSRLWRMINHEEEPVMPPGSDKLPADQLATIRAWIEEGMLKDAGSKPMASRKPAIAAVDPSSLGKPVGEPAMPVGLFREPVLTSTVPGPIDSVATSPWAPLVAVPWQRQVSLYHTETQELLGVIPYLDGAPRVVRFSRDGSLLLIAGGRDGASGKAALYDVKSGARLATIGDELDAVLAADLSPDNRLVAIGGPKKKVRVYRVTDGSLAYTCEKHTDWITALSFSPDGKLLATGDRSGGLRLWDASAGHERADLRGHKSTITAIDWRRDGGLLASSSEDKSVRLWNAEGVSIKSINAHGGGTLAVAFAGDGRLVTTGRDRRVKAWKPDGAHLADMKPLPEIGLAVAFANDGKHVIASDWSGTVQIFSVESKQPVGKLAANPPTLATRLRRAEARLATSEQRRIDAEAKRDAALIAIEAGRKRHTEHGKKLEAARLAAAEDAEAVVAAEAIATAREQEVTKASELLAKARKQFQNAKKDLANSSNEPDSEKASIAEEAERLADALDSARGARNAARTALAAKKKLYEQAAIDSVAAQKRKKVSEKLAASLTSQAAGLPDLNALEAEVAKSKGTLKQADDEMVAVTAKRDKLSAEIAAYERAADDLAAEVAAATKRKEELTKEVDHLAGDRDERAAILNKLAEENERLRKRVQELKQALEVAAKRHRDAVAGLAEAEKPLEAKSREVAKAERQALLAEARLASLREVEAWRQAHDAQDQP